jgi:hypothetical protein
LPRAQTGQSFGDARPLKDPYLPSGQDLHAYACDVVATPAVLTAYKPRAHVLQLVADQVFAYFPVAHGVRSTPFAQL